MRARSIISGVLGTALLLCVALLAFGAGAQAAGDEYYCAAPPGGVDDYYVPGDEYCPGDGDGDGGGSGGGGTGGGGSGGGGTGGGGSGGGGSTGRVCTASVGKVTKSGIGRFDLGIPREQVKSALKAPPRRSAVGQQQFCVKGGGYIGVSYKRDISVAAVVSAPGYSLRGINLGDTEKSLPKRKKLGKDIFRLRNGGIIGMRKGFVGYLGVVSESVSGKKTIVRLVKRANG